MTIKYTVLTHFSEETLDLLFLQSINRGVDLFKIKQFFKEHNLFSKSISELVKIKFIGINSWNNTDIRDLAAFINMISSYTEIMLIETPKMKYIKTNYNNEVIIDNDLIIECIANGLKKYYLYDDQNRLIKTFTKPEYSNSAPSVAGDTYYFTYGIEGVDDYYIMSFNSFSNINNISSQIRKYRKDLSRVQIATPRWNCKYNEYSDCVIDFCFKLSSRGEMKQSRNKVRDHYKVHRKYENSKLVECTSNTVFEYSRTEIQYLENGNVLHKLWDYQQSNDCTEYLYEYIYENDVLKEILCNSEVMLQFYTKDLNHE